MYPKKKKIKLTTRGLDLAEVEKGEVTPDSSAPKSDIHFFIQNYYLTFSTNSETEL